MLLEPIIREASTSAFEAVFSKTKIIKSTLDNFSAARGATLMVTRPVLKRLLYKASMKSTEMLPVNI